MLQRRITALVIMALVSTSTPAVYQIGVEPRLQGANCEISITSLEMDQESTKLGVASFRAYLRVDNQAPVDVILSQLNLDVYHHSAAIGRYQKIGTLQTDLEYKIGYKEGEDYIYSHIDADGNLETYYPEESDRIPVVANLTFVEDSIGGHATTEAIGNLISLGYLSVMLKGNAQVGPFSFEYERYQTLTLDFWDPNFVIDDVFPLLESRSVFDNPYYDGVSDYSDSGVGKYVIKAKMHNPSRLPMVIRDLNFSLIDNNDQIRAYGLGMAEETLSASYDPDVLDDELADTRKTLKDTFNAGETDIELPSDPDEWVDVFFALDFNDPNYPNPNNINSKTRDNLRWFFNKLMTEGSLDGLRFRGSLKMILGYLDGPNYKGIYVSVGDDDPTKSTFNINHVKLHQLHYEPFDGQSPTSIQNLMVPQNVVVDVVTVNTQTKDIQFDMSSVMNITNPYRFDMDITDLTTNYYRVEKTNPNNYALQYDFGSTNVPDVRTLTIDRAEMNSTFALNGTSGPVLIKTTQVPHDFSMVFNTDDFINNSGIAAMLKDLEINPQVVNWTDPFALMSPQVMHVEPLMILQNLFTNDLDPLMLLNKSTVTKYVHSGGDAYFPLGAMFFGSEDHPSGDRSKESKHMTEMDGHVESVIGGIGATPFRVFGNWDGIGEDPNKQWEIAAVHPAAGAGNEWIWDSTHDSPLLRGMPGVITTSLYRQGINPSGLSDTNFTNNYWWRIYGEPNGASPTDDYDFGYYYDYNEELRDYYMVYDSAFNGGGAEAVAFVQNFTLMDSHTTTPTNNAPQNLHSSDILKATLSISYRYPTGNPNPTALLPSDQPFGRLGIGNYDDQGATYAYDYTITPDVHISNIYSAGAGTALFGAMLTGEVGSTEWQSLSMDITEIIQNQLDAYDISNDENDLKMEVVFGTIQSIPGMMYFDDVVLYIEYEETNPNSPFEIADLFKYTEEHQPILGNMWNLMDETGFNATKYIGFIGNDLDLGVNGMDNPDVVSFFESTDVSLSDMSYLMSKEPTSFGASEPTNFFEMLNDSRYIIPDPLSTAPRVDIPGYGYRDELDNLWVIEDPYAASRAISEILARKIHTDEFGNIKPPSGVYGEELWMMFDNLEVYMPWIIMYLYSKGWTKSDVFDMLESLGFASEVKKNYVADDARGTLSVTMDVTGHMTILGNIMDDRVHMKFGMGQTVSAGYQELFRYLFDGTSGTGASLHTFAGDMVDHSRPLIQSGGDFTNAVPWTGDSAGKILWIDITIHLVITPVDFTLDIWMQNLVPDYGAPPNDFNETTNPYLHYSGTPDASGLNDIGSKLMSSLVRTNYKFADQSFISSGGDPISLFMFLDDYFFTEMDVTSPYGQPYTADYSSYALLDYFNVKSTDFIDLITGYNWMTDNFDDNGNGKVDDWRPKEDLVNNGGHGDGIYDLDGTPTSAEWNGWGTNFWDQRIFWHPSDDGNANNGGVMWSDSPDLIYISPDDDERDRAHLRGEVYLGGGAGSPDDPTEGAPPIVNLIDMMAWLSKTTGNPDPNIWFDWLIGELGWEYYTIVDCTDGTGRLYNTNNPNLWKNGIGLQNTWGMLQNCTFNVTGMFNWFENVKNANPWELMWELDNFDVSHGEGNEAPDPGNLLFFALNPNLIMTPDGRIKAAFHQSLGGTIQESKQFLWQLYNSSYWEEKFGSGTNEELFSIELFRQFTDIEYYYNDVNFNAFIMFMNLNIDPESWWNAIQYDTSSAMNPLDVLFASSKLDIVSLMEAAKNAGLSSKFKINGTFDIGLNGLNLTTTGWDDNTINYLMTPVLFTAAYHWADFIDPDNLYRSTFIIL